MALLDAGADLTMKDKGGFTAIEYAAGRAHGKSVEHYNGPAVKLFLSQTPLGQQLFDLLQQHGVQRFTDAVLKEGIHDVQALADVLSDPRLDGAWSQDKLDMGMGHVLTLLLLRHAKDLLSFVPGGAGSKRARDEFETHAESPSCCLFMTPTT